MISPPTRLAPIMLIGVFLPASAVAQEAADSAAAARVNEVVDVLSSGDYATMLQYVESNLAPDWLAEIPAEQHMNIWMATWDRSRGLEVLSVEAGDQPNTAVAITRAALSGDRQRLSVRVEPKPPYRIAGIQLGPAPASDRPDPGNEDRPADPRTDAEFARELGTFVDRLADADVFSGVVLVAREGEPIYTAVHGEASKAYGVPNRRDTKFNLGSMNKMFTAIAILQLAERGSLSLQDTVGQFLPDFPVEAVRRKVRIEHLLTHTSGLGSYFNREFQEGSRARWRTVSEFLELAHDDSLRFESGTRWSYSNTGFLLLGAIIEAVTGTSYDEHVRENIYAPAGMINTDTYEMDRPVPNLAIGYEKEFGPKGVGWRNNLFEHVIKGGPAGGGFSTAPDLLAFAEALKAGKLVAPETLERMTTPKPELSSPEYGYGFGTDANGYGHSGGFPGISSDLYIYREGGWVAVVLSNYGGGSQPVVNRIRELMM